MKKLLSLALTTLVALHGANATDISVDNAHVDVNSGNNGTGNFWLNFGGARSAEGIGSQRTSGAGQYGLDFYTWYGTRRMHIGVLGGVNVGGLADPGAGYLQA